MGDEDVIKRRLLIDGDGTGDDRRLNLLLKQFIKWCNTDNEPQSESNAIQDRMLLQLSQCEYTFAKSRIMSHMSEIELNNYGLLAKGIEDQIKNAKLVIEETKKELEKARIIRKNRTEYEVIANIIQQHPPRKETNNKLTQIKKELHTLEETKREVDKKFEIRRKHFHVLVASLNQLQIMLDEENENIDESQVDISDEEIDSYKGVATEIMEE